MTQLVHVLEAHLDYLYLVASDLSEIPLQVLNLGTCFRCVLCHWNLLKLLELSQ